jgi:hypothetical protein
MYSFKFEDVNIQVDGENPVIHTNILGTVSQGWPSPTDDSGELSGGETVKRTVWCSFHQDVDVVHVAGQSDDVVLRTNIISWRDILKYLEEYRSARMKGTLRIFQNPAGHTAYGTIDFIWAHSGSSFAYKAAIYTIAGSPGSYTHNLSFIHGRIRPQWYVTELEYDILYRLSDFMFVSEARSTLSYE